MNDQSTYLLGLVLSVIAILVSINILIKEREDNQIFPVKNSSLKITCTIVLIIGIVGATANLIFLGNLK